MRAKSWNVGLGLSVVLGLCTAVTALSGSEHYTVLSDKDMLLAGGAEGYPFESCSKCAVAACHEAPCRDNAETVIASDGLTYFVTGEETNRPYRYDGYVLCYTAYWSCNKPLCKDCCYTPYKKYLWCGAAD